MKRIIKCKTMGVPGRDFCFRMEDVSCIEEASPEMKGFYPHEKWSTVYFRNGLWFRVDVPYNTMEEYLAEP